MGQLMLWSQSQKLHSKLLNVVSGKVYAVKWHYGFAIHCMQIRKGWQPYNWHSIAAIILTRCRRQGYLSSTQHRGGIRKDNAPAVQLLPSFLLWVTWWGGRLFPVPSPWCSCYIFSALPEGMGFFSDAYPKFPLNVCCSLPLPLLTLVPDSCRICTTKCLSAGAE